VSDSIFAISLFVIVIIIGIHEVFTVAQVEGESMYPCLHHGQYVILSRLFKLKVGNIYVFKAPNGKIAVKRLIYLQDSKCFFEGDNKANSMDSRYYGFVDAENIIARLLWYKKHTN
jgi:phage repressor protein C with HTH and peptisase S24 domain